MACSSTRPRELTFEHLYKDDLKKIEKEMDRIIKKKLPIRQEVVSRAEAKRQKFSKVRIHGLRVQVTDYYARALTFEILFFPLTCSKLNHYKAHYGAQGALQAGASGRHS